MKLPNPNLSKMYRDKDPHFEHDCATCVFLGHYSGRGHNPQGAEMPMDLYVCRQGGIFPTIVARTGNDGPDYCSGIPSGGAHDHDGIAEGLKRALALGYLRIRYDVTDRYSFEVDMQIAEAKDKGILPLTQEDKEANKKECTREWRWRLRCSLGPILDGRHGQSLRWSR